MIKPKRFLEYDRRTRVFRMRWSVETTCGVCGKNLVQVFEAPPEKSELLVALTIPCDRCFGIMEKEFFQKPKPRARTRQIKSTRKKCNQLHKRRNENGST